jgi:hypothetical protein
MDMFVAHVGSPVFEVRFSQSAGSDWTRLAVIHCS